MNKTSAKSENIPLKITGIYFLVGMAYIFFSDYLVSIFQMIDWDYAQTIKGSIFIVLTSTLLFWLLKKKVDRIHIYENQLEKSLAEKEVLLKEIHHRVKNNLQVISGLLFLQSQHLSDSKGVALFRETQNRIRSIAMIHEELYQSENLERINIRDYLTNLMNYLFRSYNLKSSNIMWSLQSPDIAMNIEYALPCGLILTELVSNSFKYAFSRRTKGEIKVQLKKEGHCIYFIISDNGIGLPSGVDIAESETLGFQLVYNLVQQLRGQIRIRREEGTEFEIHFKEPEIQS